MNEAFKKKDIISVIYEDENSERKHKIYTHKDDVPEVILNYCDEDSNIFLSKNCRVVSVTILKDGDEEDVCIGGIDNISIFTIKNNKGVLEEYYDEKSIVYSNKIIAGAGVFNI